MQTSYPTRPTLATADDPHHPPQFHPIIDPRRPRPAPPSLCEQLAQRCETTADELAADPLAVVYWRDEAARWQRHAADWDARVDRLRAQQGGAPHDRRPDPLRLHGRDPLRRDYGHAPPAQAQAQAQAISPHTGGNPCLN